MRDPHAGRACAASGSRHPRRPQPRGTRRPDCLWRPGPWRGTPDARGRAAVRPAGPPRAGRGLRSPGSRPGHRWGAPRRAPRGPGRRAASGSPLPLDRVIGKVVGEAQGGEVLRGLGEHRLDEAHRLGVATPGTRQCRPQRRARPGVGDAVDHGYNARRILTGLRPHLGLHREQPIPILAPGIRGRIVERAGARFNRSRRLRVRDERRADIHAAFVALRTALTFLKYLRPAH